MSIVVLGAVFVDIKGYPAAQFIPGGRNSGRIRQVHGGVSRNIAEDIANCSLPSRFVSLVDHSAQGTEVIDHLREKGVDTRFIRRTKDGMGCWLAIFDNRGDVTAAISKRPDLSPIADLLDEQGDAIFSDAQSILLEIDMEKKIVERVLRYAKKYHLPVYAAVSNMSIAVQHRDMLLTADCLVCNRQEAGILFDEDYERLTPAEMQRVLKEKVSQTGIPRMVITLGDQGAVYADLQGESGHCPAANVKVQDTTGAGDAFFAGCAAGLTCHKSLGEACAIGTRLAAAVIASTENVCPPIPPAELGLASVNP